MKVVVKLVLDIDQNAWRYRFDPSFEMVHADDVRRSVQSEITSRMLKELREAGLLTPTRES